MIDDAIIKQNRAVYNVIAGHFSATRSFLWRDLGHLLKYFKTGDNVLDLGCGNGRLYQLFTGLSSADTSSGETQQKPVEVHYIGLDISEQLIAIAQKHYPQATFIVGDMQQLPYESAQFDVVCSIVAFHHLPTPAMQRSCLQEIKRVLRPGGHLIMLNWNAYSGWVKNKLDSGVYEDLGQQLFRVPWKTQQREHKGDRIYYGFRLEELAQLSTTTGFEILDQYYLRHGERSDIHQGMNIVSIGRS